MAIGDAGAMPDGRPVSMVTAAFPLRPDDAVAIARRWFDAGVSVVVDVPGSVAAASVQALAQAQGRTALITGSIDPSLTGPSCAPFGSSWSTDSAATTTALARALAKSDSRKWFLVTPDTVLGLAVQSDALRAIEASGGQVVGRSRYPPDIADFAWVVRQVKASGATAIGLCDINQNLVLLFAQFQAAGLFDDGRTVTAFLSSIVDLHAAATGAARGLLLAASFYWNQNEQTRAFANRFIAETARMPDPAHAAAYAAVRHYLRAVAVTESLDAYQVNQEMRRTPVYFFGRSARLRLDGRLAIDLSLLRVKPPEAMTGAWDFYQDVGAVPAADIYPPLNRSGCASRP
jgi:branched-chain amino acid transport system substrate-binding protein